MNNPQKSSPAQLRVTYAALLSLVGFFVLGCEPKGSSDPVTAETSNNAVSQKTSGVRLDYIDNDVSPAQDFFEYANGAWLKATEIPADKSRYGAFDILRDKAREDVKSIVQNASDHTDANTAGTEAQQIAAFYQSFLDEDAIATAGLAPLEAALQPIKNISSTSDLAAVFAQAHRQNINTPLGFYVNTDEKQPDEYIVYFNQAGLGLPDRDYYLSEEDKFLTIQKHYQEHILAMFELAGIESSTDEVASIYAIELALAQEHWPREDLRDRDKTYNKLTDAELRSLSSGFDWTTYLDVAGISAPESQVISAPSYFEFIGNVVGQFPLADWQKYLTWHTISRYSSYLTKPLELEDFRFYGTVLSGTTEQEDRWKRAINLLSQQLGDPIGKLYVDQYFPPQAKDRMVELVENLREAYRQSIEGLDWMGEETTLKAIEKLEKFTPKIGYPDEWKDFRSLQIVNNDLIGNVQRATEFHYQYEINKLGKPVNRNEWFMSPQTVNAYYNPGMNEIVFPAAILQPPFFNLQADDAINYGAIGAVIGHEMGHGFDDQGAKSDGDGLLQNWWTEQDFEEFGQRTSKLVAQYEEFTVLDDVHVNGSLTLGENIGDLGGLTIAHKAFEISQQGNTPDDIDGFSGEQRFFLGWAQVWANKYRDEELQRRILTDPHSPAQFRTNGVVRNMPQFHSAFEIKDGDSMYLPSVEQVKIW